VLAWHQNIGGEKAVKWQMREREMESSDLLVEESFLSIIYEKLIIITTVTWGGLH